MKRALSILYAKATATSSRRFNLGWMAALSVVGAVIAARQTPTLAWAVAAFFIDLFVCAVLLVLVTLVWDWIDRHDP